jgi:hypothetical protein
VIHPCVCWTLDPPPYIATRGYYRAYQARQVAYSLYDCCMTYERLLKANQDLLQSDGQR